MTLFNDVNCAVYGTLLAPGGAQVALISIRGKMAIVRDQQGQTFACQYKILCCPLDINLDTFANITIAKAAKIAKVDKEPVAVVIPQKTQEAIKPISKPAGKKKKPEPPQTNLLF